MRGDEKPETQDQRPTTKLPMATSTTKPGGVKRTAQKTGPSISVREFLSLKGVKGDLLLQVDGKVVSLTSLERVTGRTRSLRSSTCCAITCLLATRSCRF